MSYSLLAILMTGCVALLLLERRGLSTTLMLNFKGDVKRESRWLAQYGQGACTVVAALLIWRLDPRAPRLLPPLLVGVFGTSVLAMLIKRLVGRVRPNRENAGRFLGPTWRHANWRESFPSSHSASAVALSVLLASFYPPGREIFWALALICALLRYLMDAHWPSDVLGGIALGYAAASAAATFGRM